GLEDIVETIDQRAAEQNMVLDARYILLWEIVNGDTGPSSFLGKVSAVLPAFSSFIQSLTDAVMSRGVAALFDLIATPPTLSDYATHQQQLQIDVATGKDILLVAHSQGNLFMNVAYDCGATTLTAAPFLRAVHIAPASATLRGDYTLADNDHVINLLRTTLNLQGGGDAGISVPISILGSVQPSNVHIPS